MKTKKYSKQEIIDLINKDQLTPNIVAHYLGDYRVPIDLIFKLKKIKLDLIEEDYKKKALEVFKKEIPKLETPEENREKFFNFLKESIIYRSLTEINEEEDSTKPLEDTDEVISLVTGSSMEKLENFVSYGGGIVNSLGDATVWKDGKACVLGLEAQELGIAPERTEYYSYGCQSSDLLLGTPGVLIFKIPKKFVFCQKVIGEYFVPEYNYDKIKEYEIIPIEKYMENYYS